jgi:hypothetical protein
MLVNNVTYYKCLCLSKIYHDPDLPNNLLQAYRIVLGIFCLYSCIINNWLYFLEFLDIFLINYMSELSIEPNQVNMFPGSGNSSGAHQYGYFHSGGGGSFGGDPFGGGPSGSGGSRPPVDNQSLIDQNEDSNKSKGKKRVHWAPEAMGNDKDETNSERPYKKPDYRKDFKPVRLAPPGPKFLYFDRASNRVIYPETYHTYNPICIRDNTIREYNELGLKYVYHIYGDNPFCRIYSPDGTKIEIYNVRTVMKYIEYHKNEVTIARRQKDSYDYVESYKKRFEPYKSKGKLLAEANIKEELKKYVDSLDNEEVKKFMDDRKKKYLEDTKKKKR